MYCEVTPPTECPYRILYLVWRTVTLSWYEKFQIYQKYPPVGNHHATSDWGHILISEISRPVNWFRLNWYEQHASHLINYRDIPMLGKMGNFSSNTGFLSDVGWISWQQNRSCSLQVWSEEWESEIAKVVGSKTMLSITIRV